MARQEVVQLRCDRCKRVELVPPTPKKDKPDFEARHGEERVVFEDLCFRCQQAIKNIWTDLKEWDREIKQAFGPTVAPNTAPPLQSAPDYSPPKPHSVASTKR
jgi:hypothetical protein